MRRAIICAAVVAVLTGGALLVREGRTPAGPNRAFYGSESSQVVVSHRSEPGTPRAASEGVKALSTRRVYKSTRNVDTAESRCVGNLLERMEHALVVEDVDAIMANRREIIAWFEEDPARLSLLVDLVGFGPVELQVEVARLVNLTRHIDETVLYDYLEAERELVRAREDALPTSATSLEAIARDNDAAIGERSAALERLVRLHGDDPGIVDVLAGMAEVPGLRVGSIAMLTNIDHPARGDVVRRYVDAADLEVRAAALRVAGFIEEDWATDALLSAAREPLLAALALGALRVHVRPDATQALVEAARSGRIDLLEPAVHSLVHHARSSPVARAEIERLSREAGDLDVLESVGRELVRR